MRREPFDLLGFPLEGLRLIEASAGTGKTFSLAGLYLRLLVEKRLDVRDILVMTFTRAATQELRERIRTRLADAARVAADPGTADPAAGEDAIALAIVERSATHEPRESIARRLREAAARMDEATISTIHAFAQQAAQENAFDSGLPFDRGTQVDDAEIQREAIADYWRGQVIGRSRAEAGAFLTLWPDPDRLARDLKPALDKPHLRLQGPPDEEIVRLHTRARELWPMQAPALRDLLEQALAHDALRKNEPLRLAIVRSGDVAGLLADLEAGLSGTASGIPVLPSWVADLATPDGVQKHFKKPTKPTVKNPVAEYRPQDLELVRVIAELTSVARVAATRAACATVRGTIRSRKAAARQFSFADMIEALHEAVTDPARGPALADALHRNWPYALVDEFQDTDPLQYEILRRTYRGRDAGALIMIGDPKQAIYGFRGGDVFAYLSAARDADGCYELDTNYRSTSGVLEGIEALFTGPAQHTQYGEFLIPEIRFHTVKAGRAPGDRVIVHHGAPLPSITAWTLDDVLKVPEAKRILLDATVAEICALLHPRTGARTRDADGEVPVAPSDIAVLVNTNREAADVQRALALRGVAAVCLQRASVFESDEARDLLYVLRAAESSARPEAIRAALGTPVFGLRMGDLLRLMADEAAWHRAVARFQAAHETWRTRGLLALLEPLLQEAGPRVLALDDGERRMTNYLQLAELLAHAETETFGLAGLVRWLAEQIDNPDGESAPDARQLRLESDDALVRIATIHRVKGLQYRIVFVPFAPTLAPKAPKLPWTYHDASGRACLDFGPEGAASEAAAALESRAESLRLLYVALTRAEQACYVGWGAINTAQNSALAWLLHADAIEAPGAIADPRSKLPDWLASSAARARLDAWAARAPGAIRVVPPPRPLASDYRAPAGPPPAGTARTDLPARRPDWSVYSFSRLVAGGLQRVPGSGDDDESPDPAPELRASPPSDTATIPLRGPAFGIAIHQLLESIEPAAWPGPDEAPQGHHHALAARHLANAGVALGDGAARGALLEAVAQLITRTLHTPLPEIGPLAHVPRERRRVEMEFYLALGGERVGPVLDYLGAHGYGTGLTAERRQQALMGLMQGFVDLTVEADGRYWIVDYKTNDLGPHAQDYQPDALARAVRHGHYDLQYLIYLVALHRHLARTLSGYDPARHLGGAQYLFLRGLNGTDASTGVFVDRPHPEFITGLDARFGGRSSAA